MIKNIFKFSFAIALTAAISAFLLAKVYLVAKPNIEQQKINAENSAKNVIFPGATYTKVNDSIFPYEIAKKDGKIIGYLFKASKYGYSSDDVSLVGVDKDMIIKGIVVLSQSETPGLGARVDEVQNDKYVWTFWKKSKSENSRPWFQQQFEGLNALKLNYKKGKEWKDLDKSAKEKLIATNTITVLSGATISSNAVMSSIKEAAQILKQRLSSTKIDTVEPKEVVKDTVNDSLNVKKVSDSLNIENNDSTKLNKESK